MTAPQKSRQFYKCNLCKNISYKTLKFVYSPCSTYTIPEGQYIDGDLQKYVLRGFYLLFPQYIRSNEVVTVHERRNKEKLQNCWRYLFLNAVHVLRNDEKYMSLSLDRNHYKDSIRHKIKYWGYKHLQEVITVSDSQGYFEKTTGSHYSKGIGKPYVTRLRVTDKFRNMVSATFEEMKDDLQLESVEDLIEVMPLPAERKPEIILEQKDGEWVAPVGRIPDEMGKRVREYIDYMSLQNIEFFIPLENCKSKKLKLKLDKQFNDLRHKVSRGYIEPVDHTYTSYKIVNFQVYRKFKHSMKKGGRYYGSIHANLAQVIRATTLINGEPTVELDFKALHPSMLYSKIGEKIPADCYYHSRKKDEIGRMINKRAFMTVFNSDSVETAIKSLMDKRKWKKKPRFRLTKRKCKKWIKDFLTQNPKLKQFAFTGVGLELQYLDSCMMEQILLRCVKKDIPVIGVHDSVIVPQSKELEVRKIMQGAWMKVMRTETKIIIERK